MGKKREKAEKGKAAPPSWPDRVRSLLEQYQFTQALLSQRLGVSRTNVNNFLSGHRVPPRPVQKLIVRMENGDDLSDVQEI